MTDSQRQSFKLHLPGLLKVLAEHLYSQKPVAIRELLQNAHDSCVRRALEYKEPQYRPRIRVTVNPAAHTLTISDNGCGLTAEEIDTYLTTIGRSYTRDLRDRLALLSWNEASRLIGQFGFGFLSAFLIASDIRLTTWSLRPGSQPLCWRSSGDEYYELGPGERDAPGTTIELTIKPSAAFATQTALVVETIQRYADFLPDPIYVNDDPAPVNLMAPPWDARDPRVAIGDYIERAFGVAEPLAVIPLHDQMIDLGHDSLALPLRGFVFIPPSTVISVREYGDLRVFIRGMLICEDERQLLPPWARFVRGVVDCPSLQPTASRESIHQDETFTAIQQALETQLSAALRRIAAEQPALWRQIVRGHADVITGWAAKDALFFEQVADLVPFGTTRGRLTLPEYLALTGGTLYYTSKQIGSLQEQLLAEGRDMPVIDAAWFAVIGFLQQYAARRQGIRMVHLDGDVQKLLRPIDDPTFAPLLAAYAQRGVRARLAAFQPAEIPAVLLYPPDVDRLRDVRDALAGSQLAAPFADLVGGYLAERLPDPQELSGTLYLNASCPLTRQLAATPPAEATFQATLTLLHQIARLFAGRGLLPDDARGAFQAATAAIQELIR